MSKEGAAVGMGPDADEGAEGADEAEGLPEASPRAGNHGDGMKWGAWHRRRSSGRRVVAHLVREQDGPEAPRQGEPLADVEEKEGLPVQDDGLQRTREEDGADG